MSFRVALGLLTLLALLGAPAAVADTDGPYESCVYTGIQNPEVSVTPQTCIIIVKAILHDVHQAVGTGGRIP